MDSVFQALAHETRRAILDHLRDHPGMAVGELAAHFDVSRIAVMNHLRVLTEAQLITSRKEGRSRRLYLNALPLQLIYERWIDGYSAHWLDRMSLIKATAEAVAKKEIGK
ncbi:ArsR/SmtB family transcription factor [Sulfitobacter donghicola]|nr:metalloregulator ArsR/SmtB family transcription factor [Sulfitobacter donghicola]KIN68137.1 Transcriptional regulator, ArsR family [Sulfitobacter donghicola DSW-25 = KCTC 12864 = JCM 14565]